MTYTRAATPWKLLSGMVLGVMAIAFFLVDQAAPSKAASGYEYKEKERCFMRKINKARKRHELGKLDRDKQLGYVGRKHAKSMARSNDIWHDSNLGNKVTRWRRLGDNVGMGGGCKKVFKAFMDSKAHKDNILGKWRHFAAGTKCKNGKVFVEVIFESKRNPDNKYNYP